MEKDLSKLSVADADAPPPPPAAGGFSFATAPVAGGAPAGGQSFSFNLGPPAPGPAADDDDDDDDDEDEEGTRLPKEVLQRVLGLKALDEKRTAEMEEYLKERAVLEAKYAAKLAPVFADRAKIVKGELEPTLSPEDLATAETAGTTTDEAEPLTGVPAFWLTAIARHDAFHAFVFESDFPCLKHLTDVRSIDDADLKGFRLEFEFAPNPFFTNTVLTKAYQIPNLVDANGQPELEGVEGCDIDWANPRDCLARREVKKKQKSKRGKNAGATRVVTKVEDKPSFFHFFDAIKLPTGEEDDEEVADDEALREKIDNDVELAFALRNQIVPHAVLWFTGEAVDSDEDEDFEYDEDEDDD